MNRRSPLVDIALIVLGLLGSAALIVGIGFVLWLAFLVIQMRIHG
jgi:hypothetical protein